MKGLLIIMLMIVSAYVYFNYFGERPESLIGDVTLTSNGKQKNLGIDFNAPVRYLGHFPEEHGQILQIRIRAISFDGFNKNNSIMDRIIKSGSGDALIDDVRYEGSVPGGPFLIVKFRKPIFFKVVEGDGLRSLNVSFSAS